MTLEASTCCNLLPIVGLAILAAVGSALFAGVQNREIRRMANELRGLRPDDNPRQTLACSTTATTALARAVNALIDSRAASHAEELRQRQAFRRDLAALSHDIRTPLAGAQGYLELYGLAIEQESTSKDGQNSPYRDDSLHGVGRTDNPALYIEAARERLSVMRMLVDGLFDYARASSLIPGDGLVLERVEVLPLLADVLASQYPAFADRGWDPCVSFDSEQMTAVADRNALVRVFGNLVTNALHHGCSAPTIEQRGSTLLFSNRVAHPAAIDPTRLFERFYQADPSCTESGRGLGLSIVAQLCNAMGIGVSARLESELLTITLDFDL